MKKVEMRELMMVLLSASVAVVHSVDCLACRRASETAVEWAEMKASRKVVWWGWTVVGKMVDVSVTWMAFSTAAKWVGAMVVLMVVRSIDCCMRVALDVKSRRLG